MGSIPLVTLHAVIGSLADSALDAKHDIPVGTGLAGLIGITSYIRGTFGGLEGISSKARGTHIGFIGFTGLAREFTGLYAGSTRR